MGRFPDTGRLKIPLATRHNGDTFRFLASTDATHVSINGAPVATLNRGQFYQQIINGPSQITSDQPILVAQYELLPVFWSTTNGSPSKDSSTN